VSATIDREVSTLTVAARCRVLGWPRAGYYRAQQPATEADIELRSLIQQIAWSGPLTATAASRLNSEGAASA
jgi:hypothetical protein